MTPRFTLRDIAWLTLLLSYWLATYIRWSPYEAQRARGGLKAEPVSVVSTPNAHPLIERDATGKLWAESGESCYDCHGLRWNLSAWPVAVRRMQWTDPVTGYDVGENPDQTQWKRPR